MTTVRYAASVLLCIACTFAAIAVFIAIVCVGIAKS